MKDGDRLGGTAAARASIGLASLIAVGARIAAGLPAGQQVLRVVQLGSREPLRAGHLSLREHLLVVLRAAHTEELPDGRPEVLDLLDRPLPELLIVVERPTATLAGPAHEARHVGARAFVGRRFPQRGLGRSAGHEGILAVCGLL
jgi:hypothetical protein